MITAFDFNEFASQQDTEQNLYQDWVAKFSLDFSKFLHGEIKNPRKFAKLTYRLQNVSNADSYGPTQSELQHALVFSYATYF